MQNAYLDNLELILDEYGKNDSNFAIKRKDILEILACHCTISNFKLDILTLTEQTNFDDFFDALSHSFSNHSSKFSVYSLICLIDLMFDKSIEHHGVKILGAKKMIGNGDLGFPEDYPVYDSWPANKLDTYEYYDSLIESRKLWKKLSWDLKEDAAEKLFPKF